MTREELLEARKKLMETLKERRALGEFDANSKTILLLLEGELLIVQHLLAGLKKP